MDAENKKKSRNSKRKRGRKSDRAADNKAAVSNGTCGKPEATRNLDTQDIKANDPAWYMGGPGGPIPYIVPFTNALGQPVKLGMEAPGANIMAEDYLPGSLPGIMTLEYCPTYGNMTNSGDPLNMGFTRLHTMLRYGQSYSHTYDAAHLGAHLIMTDQLITMITMLRRVYGLLRWYSSINTHMPKTYVTALGFDFEDLAFTKMEQFRQFINSLVRRVAMLKVPANWKMFLRHQFMCETIYMDSPSVKSQMYAFVPAFFYKYVVTADSWKLEPVPFRYTSKRNLGSIMNYCNEIVNSYVYDEDAVIISADMLRIYGNDGCYKLSEIDPNYTTQPVYDPTIIAQIHNATVMGNPYNASNPSFNITQDPVSGCLLCLPSFIIPSNVAIPTLGTAYTRILDCPSDKPDANYVAEATRLMYITSASTNTSDKTVTLGIVSCGTELITVAHIWNVDTNGTITNKNPVLYIGTDATADAYTKFDNAPLVYKTTGVIEADGAHVKLAAIVGNMNNYTFINGRVLDEMHSNAQYSLFDIPVLDTAKIAVAK